jgi:hypothetical protein
MDLLRGATRTYGPARRGHPLTDPNLPFSIKLSQFRKAPNFTFKTVIQAFHLQKKITQNFHFHNVKQ